MRIKAGKFTLALTMIACGILMLFNTLYGNGVFRDLWVYSPVVLVIFGLEIIILNLVYMNKENYKVEISVGSIILIIFIIAFFMMGTNKAQLHDPFFDNFLLLSPLK